MTGTLGRPVIIEVKPGANGNIAAQWVADGPTDGSLVWVGAQSMLEINPTAYKNLRWKQSDFIPVIKGIETPLILVAHPSVPAKTFDEWVAYAKANRGKLSYANYGPGTISHFLGYQLNERFGLELAQVPYRGNAPQMIDLLAGHALFGFTQLQSATEPSRSGLLRALVSSGEKRSALLPDVPTFADVGHADLAATAWFGLLLKTGTPDDVVARLEAAAKAAHADPRVQEKLAAQGFQVERADRTGLQGKHRRADRALGEDRESHRLFGGLAAQADRQLAATRSWATVSGRRWRWRRSAASPPPRRSPTGETRGRTAPPPGTSGRVLQSTQTHMSRLPACWPLDAPRCWRIGQTITAGISAKCELVHTSAEQFAWSDSGSPTPPRPGSR